MLFVRAFVTSGAGVTCEPGSPQSSTQRPLEIWLPLVLLDVVRGCRAAIASTGAARAGPESNLPQLRGTVAAPPVRKRARVAKTGGARSRIVGLWPAGRAPSIHFQSTGMRCGFTESRPAAGSPAASCFPPPPPTPVVASAVLARAPPDRPCQCQQPNFSSMSAMSPDVLHAMMTGGVRAAAVIRRLNAASRRQMSGDTILDFVDVGDEGAGHYDLPPRIPATRSMRTRIPPTTVPAECRNRGRIRNAHAPASVRTGADVAR